MEFAGIQANEITSVTSNKKVTEIKYQKDSFTY